MDNIPEIRYRNLPTVVLAGRPNVGKSTLFNRLLHKRRSITDPTPGVTRDPVGENAFIAGKPLRLIDTGGFKLDREKEEGSLESMLDDMVVEKTLETLKQADLIILILEAGHITPEDEDFIALLRQYQDRLILAVNKTEGGRLEQESWNLLSYGFEEIFMISAEHGDNVGALENAIVKRLDFSRVEEDDGKRPIRIALLGKPNTGKSTLANRLTGEEGSLVSEKPGTTRDVVEGAFAYKNYQFKILDTAGIRRKSKVTENIEYYSVNRAIKSIEDADVVFLLIDAQEGLSDQDKKIAALAHDKGRGIILVLNKWDAMPDIKNTFQAVSDRIRFLFGQMEYAPIIPISAMNGTGMTELLNAAVRLYGQLTRRIDTSDLNMALEKWMEENPPPIGPRSRFKIKYAIQATENPVKFILFVSRIQAASDAYIAYIRNRMRKDLGFSQIPLLLELRSSRKPKKSK